MHRFARRPVVYIHESYRSKAVALLVAELHMDIALWNYGFILHKEMSRRSPLFDPKFGFVGPPGSGAALIIKET